MKTISLYSENSAYIDFSKFLNNELTVTGMVSNIRILSWGGFIILRLPLYTLQCVISGDTTGTPIKDIRTESSVRITGKVVASTIKDVSIYPRNIELHVTKMELVSSPSIAALPVDTSKKELQVNLDTKLDLRPLTLRHPREKAVFRISAEIMNSFGEFLANNGFTRIASPKIVFSGAEGGANVFKLDYFGRDAYLAQSPQFYKQMMVGVFGRVFEVGPVFRAEKHNTSRHINEYTSLDLEMQLQNGFLDLIQMEANLLNFVFDNVRTKCSYEVELLQLNIPTIKEILLMQFDEVHEIVYKEFNIDHRGEDDLAPEEEELICKYAKDTMDSEFIFVTHYPSSKRPFYAKNDPEDETKTLSFDLLFRGVEITTGGQRLNSYDEYVAKMLSRNMNPEIFKSYLQTFSFGMPPHGGLGLGLERLTARLCKIANIKEATLFPRDIDRLEP